MYIFFYYCASYIGANGNGGGGHSSSSPFTTKPILDVDVFSATTVLWHMNAGTVEPEETLTARQPLCKHIPSATNTQATMELLFGAIFSIRSVQCRGKPNYIRKTCSSATCPPQMPHDDRVSNPGCRGGKPVTNRINYGTTKFILLVS
jgi:hypothetical protein